MYDEQIISSFLCSLFFIFSQSTKYTLYTFCVFACVFKILSTSRSNRCSIFSDKNKYRNYHTLSLKFSSARVLIFSCTVVCTTKDVMLFQAKCNKWSQLRSTAHELFVYDRTWNDSILNIRLRCDYVGGFRKNVCGFIILLYIEWRYN